MEDTLRVISDFDNFDDVEVLILVLMEDTLRESKLHRNGVVILCLNPCFNGRYSQSAKTCVPLYIVV